MNNLDKDEDVLVFEHLNELALTGEEEQEPDLQQDHVDLLNRCRTKRQECADCERPASVCWCPHLPDPKIRTRHQVLILQHPNEAKRGVRTALMASRGVADSRCTIVKGRKFPGQDQRVKQLLAAPSTYLLYPGEGSIDLNQLDKGGEKTLVILDGTWDEAKKLFVRNPVLSALPRVSLDVKAKSQYVVRTQPSDHCLSTVETVAHTLAVLEDDPDIVDRLVSPLHALCHFQIHHGAVTHDSKDLKAANANFVKSNNYKQKQKKKKNFYE